MHSSTLLSNFLRNPSDENYMQILTFISEQGKDDFIQSITSNNPLALIFLKKYIQDWIHSKTLPYFYSENFIVLLLNSCIHQKISRPNWTHACDFLEILSTNNLIPDSIVSNLVGQGAFVFLEAIFRKYTLLPRSNPLFLEIKRSIELLMPTFSCLFFTPQAVEDVDRAYHIALTSIQAGELIHTVPRPASIQGQAIEHILEIFYELVYQDIHPFFEDNVEYFFKVFFVLFDQNQLTINKIFDLFISKYPEITNFDMIIFTLTRLNRLDGLAVTTLTNAFSYTRAHSEVIVRFLRRTLTVEIDDWLAATQGVVSNSDVERGFVHKLIRMLNCSPSQFEGESMLFVATILKSKDSATMNLAKTIISAVVQDNVLAFTAFRYLMEIQEFVGSDPGYLETDVRFIYLKYLSCIAKSRDFFHRDTIVKTGLHSVTNLQPVPSLDILSYLQVDFLKICKLVNEQMDEFSSELFFRITKMDARLQTVDLYAFLTSLFKRLSDIPRTAFVYLFDIYILLTIKLKKYNLELVETIFNEEMIDLYNLCFMYISVLIKETNFKESFVLKIVRQNELWSTKEMHSGLSFIVISAYEKGILTEEETRKVVGMLDGYLKVLVLHCLRRSGLNITGKGRTTEEEYLTEGLFDTNWFMNNFVNKKYTRIVIKKLLKDERIDVSIRQAVIQKNIEWVEQENVLHSIIRYFDL